jgi:SAM-dependent methyltransferase
MSADRPARSEELVPVGAEALAEGPPDVDSLMSRLDAPSESSPSSASTDERPSIPGTPTRGRRRRGSTLRVPDDAVPAGTPPPAAVARRSVPPSSPTPIAPDVVAIRPARMIAIGEATPLPFPAPVFPPAAPLTPPTFEAAPAPQPAVLEAATTQPVDEPQARFEEPVAAPPPPIALPAPAYAPYATTEPIPAAPMPDFGALAFVPPAPPAEAAAEEELAPGDIEEIQPDALVGQTLLTGGLPEQRPRSVPPPPMRGSTPPPPRASASTPPPPVRIYTPPPMPVPAELAALAIPRLPTPAPAPVPAELAALALATQAEAGHAQEIAPPPPPPGEPTAGERLRTPTFENLDDQVREALQLLDGDDFEPPAVDVPLDDETTSPSLRAVSPDDAPPSGEEALIDADVVEVSPAEVEPRKRAAPPRRQSAPAPAVGAASQPTQGSVSKPPPATRPEGANGDRPALVVAAAASVSTPAAPAVAPPPTSVQVQSTEGGEVKRKKRQWFEELFNDDFARTMPKVDTRWLKREVDFVEDAMGLAKGAALLDLGCGPGVHAVQIAKRGYEVIGIDLSLAMLARASDEAAEHQQRINFVQGDMRELTFEDAFDGVLCWGATFGYFDETKNAEVVQKIHRALRKQGRLLLDVTNRDYVVPRSPSMVWFEGDGCVCMDEAQFDAINSRLKVKRTLMMEDGRSREIDYSIRLYALHELGKLLHDNGFRVTEVSGETSTPGRFFNAESPRILILAEKR